MKMTEISAISTICKNCLFAIYDNKTQIGCALDRTDKVDQHPIFELIEAEDEEKEFYILNNHICPYQRTDSWEYSDTENIIEKVNEEVYMPWAAVLFYKSTDIQSLDERVKELNSQKVKPKIVSLVIGYEEIEPAKFQTIVQTMNDNFPIWYLRKSIEKDIPDRFNFDLCFDKMRKHRFMFYGCFNSNQPIDLDYYEKIHKFVIDDMNSYGIIKNIHDDEDIHHITVSKITHLKYGGNSNGVPLEYKIAYENKDLTWMDISNKKPSNETLKDKFIIDYSVL
jgi:hypothetical protein